MMLLLIACLVVLISAVGVFSRRRTGSSQGNLGQMSERWLIEHRAAHGQ